MSYAKSRKGLTLAQRRRKGNYTTEAARGAVNGGQRQQSKKDLQGAVGGAQGQRSTRLVTTSETTETTGHHTQGEERPNSY